MTLESRLKADIITANELGAWTNGSDLWSRRMLNKNFHENFNGQVLLQMDRLSKFKRFGYLNEQPASPRFSPLGLLSGSRRGQRKLIEDRVRAMDVEELSFLNRFKMPSVGCPHTVDFRGQSLNRRWLNNVHYLYLVRDLIKPGSRMPIVVDLGGGYGQFAHILAQYLSTDRVYVVDFPEQLLLARYFLENQHGGGSVWGLSEILKDALPKKDESEVKFVLCPNSKFDLLRDLEPDLFCNFFSLGEMGRESFDHYINSPVLRKSKMFYSINRIFSAPDYDSDLNVLDYHYERYERRMSREYLAEKYYYKGKLLVFKERVKYNSAFLAFLGEKI